MALIDHLTWEGIHTHLQQAYGLDVRYFGYPYNYLTVLLVFVLYKDLLAQLQLEERHLEHQRPQRPTTPTPSPSVSPVNTPQATPHTRRRAEIRERNPPESPRRRHVPQAPQQMPPRQRRRNGVRPPQFIARQPLDPNAEVAHSLRGSFNIVYVQLFLLFLTLDVVDVEQFIGLMNEHQNPLKPT